MKKILFFIFLILPTFANSFDEHYKFDHWGYERIMFGKTESREEAKKLLDSYKPVSYTHLTLPTIYSV